MTGCIFCAIAASVPVFDPTSSPLPLEQGSYPASFEQHNVILSTQSYIAILDIQPLVSSACHILLIPRRHYERISDFPKPGANDDDDDDDGGGGGVNSDLGWLLAVLSSALRDSFRDVTDFNIVQNNGPAAGQVVPHVHTHIIARPAISTSNGPLQSSTTITHQRLEYASLIFGKGPRSDLDAEAARRTCDVLRTYLYHNYWRKHRQRMEGSKL
ncbi:HIT-like domain-containing protein [Lipomyces chichibuensis]|uniref:HIT-like domain-containing protein n=1 Tax=Lipomyces chichibuensis TaxID=1546026 RepID=UPI003343CCBF